MSEPRRLVYEIDKLGRAGAPGRVRTLILDADSQVAGGDLSIKNG